MWSVFRVISNMERTLQLTSGHDSLGEEVEENMTVRIMRFTLNGQNKPDINTCDLKQVRQSLIICWRSFQKQTAALREYSTKHPLDFLSRPQIV